MTTVLALVGLAEVLGSRVVLAGLDAVIEELLADEPIHRILVVGKTWSRAIRRAGAAVSQGVGIAGIVTGVSAAEDTAGADLTLAPLGSQRRCDGVRVNRAVLCLRSNNTSEDRNSDGRFEEHLDGCFWFGRALD